MGFLLSDVGAVTLSFVAASSFVGLEVVAHEVCLVGVLPHAQSGDSDAVQRVHVLVPSTGVLSTGCSLRGADGPTGETSRGKGELVAGIVQVDPWGYLGTVALYLHKATLQTDHVFS